MTRFENAQYASWHEQRVTEWLSRKRSALTQLDIDACAERVAYHRQQARLLRREAAEAAVADDAP